MLIVLKNSKNYYLMNCKSFRMIKNSEIYKKNLIIKSFYLSILLKYQNLWIKKSLKFKIMRFSIFSKMLSYYLENTFPKFQPLLINLSLYLIDFNRK